MTVLRMQQAERRVAGGPSAPLDLSRLEAALSHVEEVPLAQAPRLLSQLAAAQATLLARILSPAESAPPPDHDDRWLNAEEAAALLKVHRKWLYRRAKSLPFSRRLSRKKLLFSEAGLRQWMASRRA
jgi:predicted DNA-binding transcriptional regulator AlpA